MTKYNKQKKELASKVIKSFEPKRRNEHPEWFTRREFAERYERQLKQLPPKERCSWEFLEWPDRSLEYLKTLAVQGKLLSKRSHSGAYQFLVKRRMLTRAEKIELGQILNIRRWIKKGVKSEERTSKEG